MGEKKNIWLPVVLMIVFAITRWPGVLPLNFSAAYALVFCAGVFFRNRLGWWVPIAIILLSDILLNFFYYRPRGWNGFQIYQLMNYAAYGVIFWLGRRFQARSHFLSLLCGGFLSALVFYVVTNTAAWFFNPFNNQDYEHSWKSWLLAMTLGTGSWPDTWMFFRNTLLSSGLFTALFVAAMRYSEYLESSAEKKAANASENAEDAEDETQPEEA
jgi:hypothetical protein